jgi:copper chaperone
MTCGHCVNTVTRAIQSIDKSAAVQVDLQTGRVQVESSAAAADLLKAVNDAGYPAAQSKGVGLAAAPDRQSGCCCR